MNFAQMLMSGPTMTAKAAVDHGQRGRNLRQPNNKRREEMIQRYGDAFKSFGGKASGAQITAKLGLARSAWKAFKDLEDAGYLRQTTERIGKSDVWEWVK